MNKEVSDAEFGWKIHLLHTELKSIKEAYDKTKPLEVPYHSEEDKNKTSGICFRIFFLMKSIHPQFWDIAFAGSDLKQQMKSRYRKSVRSALLLFNSVTRDINFSDNRSLIRRIDRFLHFKRVLLLDLDELLVRCEYDAGIKLDEDKDSITFDENRLLIMMDEEA